MLCDPHQNTVYLDRRNIKKNILKSKVWVLRNQCYTWYLDPPEKHTICALKEYKKNIQKWKIEIFTTTTSIHMLYDTQKKIFYVE